MEADLFSNASRRSRTRALGILMLAALAARLPALLLSGGAGEQISELSPPLWAFVLAPLEALAVLLKLVGHGRDVLMKLPGLVGDLGLVATLYAVLARIAPDTPPRADEKAPPSWTGRAFWLAMVYAAHPLSVMVSAGLGSGGSLALLAVVLAAYFIEFSDDPRSDFYGALSLALALGLRVWPLALLPVFIKIYPRQEERWRFAANSLLPALLMWLPRLIQGGNYQQWWLMLNQPGELGLVPTVAKGMAILQMDSTAGLQAVVVTAYVGLLALALVYLLGKWRFPLLPGLGLAALSLLVLVPGISFDGLLMLLPLALLLPGPLALKHGLLGLGLGLLLAVWSRPTDLFNLGAERFQATGPWPWAITLLWAILNLALWIFWLVEWRRLFKLCRRPARLRFI